MANENSEQNKIGLQFSDYEKSRLQNILETEGEEAWAKELGSTLVAQLSHYGDEKTRPYATAVMQILEASLQQLEVTPKLQTNFIQGLLQELVKRGIMLTSNVSKIE